MLNEGGDETISISTTSSISNESYMNDSNNNIINNDDENDVGGFSDGSSNGDKYCLKNTGLRDSLRLTRDCVKRFETNVTIQTLKDTTNICVESIKQVGNFFLIEKLLTSQSAGLLNIIAEIIHRILNLIKSEENITKLGRNVVVSTVDTFIELIEEIIQKVGSYGSTQSWIQCSSLENLSTAFPIEACVIRKRLTFSEVQAHSKLFLFKGDL
uniref:Uncharacterized protein n=1 Tax=Panagrolaimus sp. PS1159 TaxID=55785 RepID=A0AC35FAS4_9BILA